MTRTFVQVNPSGREFDFLKTLYILYEDQTIKARISKMYKYSADKVYGLIINSGRMEAHPVISALAYNKLECMQKFPGKLDTNVPYLFDVERGVLVTKGKNIVCEDDWSELKNFKTTPERILWKDNNGELFNCANYAGNTLPVFLISTYSHLFIEPGKNGCTRAGVVAASSILSDVYKIPKSKISPYIKDGKEFSGPYMQYLSPKCLLSLENMKIHEEHNKKKLKNSTAITVVADDETVNGVDYYGSSIMLTTLVMAGLEEFKDFNVDVTVNVPTLEALPKGISISSMNIKGGELFVHIVNRMSISGKFSDDKNFSEKVVSAVSDLLDGLGFTYYIKDIAF